MTIANSTYLQEIFVQKTYLIFSYFYIKPNESHLVLKHVVVTGYSHIINVVVLMVILLIK